MHIMLDLLLANIPAKRLRQHLGAYGALIQLLQWWKKFLQRQKNVSFTAFFHKIRWFINAMDTQGHSKDRLA